MALQSGAKLSLKEKSVEIEIDEDKYVIVGAGSRVVTEYLQLLMGDSKPGDLKPEDIKLANHSASRTFLVYSCLFLVDKAGDRQPVAQDEVEKFPIGVLKQIFETAHELSGLADKEQEDAKNS